MVNVGGYAFGIVSSIGHHLAELPSGEAIVFDLAIVLIVATVLAFFARFFRQPLIPAYVLAGLIIGPLVLGFLDNIDLIYAFSEMGIAFLLFSAGLEISFRKIKGANLKKISIVGTLQIIAVFFLTFFLNKFLGVTRMQAVYLGIILAFGSTMVVIKLLSDKGELSTLHGRLVLGILLLQDFVAIFAIIILTSGGFSFSPIAVAIGKLVFILLLAVVLQKYVLNKLFKFAAMSTELLLLSSLSVLFLFVIVTYLAELSIVIGAFIAGVSLANSPFKVELESRITPLRDFFSILFFVALGMQLVFVGIGQHIYLLLFLIVGAIIIKPIITVLFLRVAGYKSRTSFLTGLSLAQLSEFSLIIGMLGLTMGVLTQEILSTVILSTIITMSLTTYFIEYKENFYKIFKRPMSLFKFFPERENLAYETQTIKTVLLAGAHRMGSLLLRESATFKKELLVVDYDPEVIGALSRKKIACIYGDLASPEVLDNVNLRNMKTVISTVPNIEANMFLLKRVKEKNKRANVILTASRISEAQELYEAGANYVILPKVVAGRDLLDILNHKGFSLKKARDEQKKLLDKIHNLLY